MTPDELERVSGLAGRVSRLKHEARVLGHLAGVQCRPPHQDRPSHGYLCYGKGGPYAEVPLELMESWIETLTARNAVALGAAKRKFAEA